jgi:hypothetical protein
MRYELAARNALIAFSNLQQSSLAPDDIRVLTSQPCTPTFFLIIASERAQRAVELALRTLALAWWSATVPGIWVLHPASIMRLIEAHELQKRARLLRRQHDASDGRV